MQNTKYKLMLVAGARPNFMKIAPLMQALKGHPDIQCILMHTGQHYDEKLSDLFFKQLNIPAPDINLGVGSGSHAVQTARIMEAFEKACLDTRPDMVMVVGDVNSTLAATLVASKLGIKTAHYEAGLRSLDRTMPEEINRLATDAISDYFFTTSSDADANLLREGIDEQKIFMVGNLMIDTLVSNLPKLADIKLEFERLNGSGGLIRVGDTHVKGDYGVMTFHRPANVDDKDMLVSMIEVWESISGSLPMVFPIHPRTFKNIQQFGLKERVDRCENVYLIDSLGYWEFIALVKNARLVLTDSGGVQEETTYLGVPCLTVRPNTERPITITEGTNTLIKIEEAVAEVGKILSGKYKKGNNPKYWDGHSAKRIVKHLEGIIFNVPQLV